MNYNCFELFILYGMEENFTISFNKNEGWLVSLGETKYIYPPECGVDIYDVFRDVIKSHFIEKGKKL